MLTTSKQKPKSGQTNTKSQSIDFGLKFLPSSNDPLWNIQFGDQQANH